MRIKHRSEIEWHWIWGGLAVSLLSIATYYLFETMKIKNYPFGITAGIGYIAAKLSWFSHAAQNNPVIIKFNNSPAAFIEFFMLIGIALGAFVAAKLSGNYKPEIIPAVWEKYIHPNPLVRFLAVLVGGFLMGWGTAFASGCTSGNILQGWAHLSPGSMIAGICFFISGIVIVQLLYRNKRGGKDVA
ncbi:YeeE/YedE family protein [bacterium]|nr:YeeE/YedE family protein [bacterium]